MYYAKRLIWLAIAVALLGISVKFFPYHCNCLPKIPKIDIYGYKTLDAKIGSTPITLEIADTNAARELGLSKRDSMPPNTGMLFEFDNPGVYGFWMKDMKFALDMIWISPQKQIISINKNVAPESYPEAFYPPSAVSFVIEVPAGYSDAHNIQVGQNLSIGQ